MPDTTPEPMTDTVEAPDQAAWMGGPAPSGTPAHERLERFTPIPRVRKIRMLMMEADRNREAIAWGTSDFSQLTTKQKDSLRVLVSALVHSESTGGDVCSNLLRRIPYTEIANAFAVQILDESNHFHMLTRYMLEELKQPIIKPAPLARLTALHLQQLRDPILCALAGSYYVECAAAEIQQEMVKKVDEPLLVSIFRAILRDEGRHQTLGREVLTYLLQTPASQGWKRARAKTYRTLMYSFSSLTLRHYRPFASRFGVDLPRIERRVIERIDATVPL